MSFPTKELDEVLPLMSINADTLDGKHKDEIIRYINAKPTSNVDLNNVFVRGAIDIRHWDYSSYAKVTNTPYDDKSSAAVAITFGTEYPLQLCSDYLGNGLWKRVFYSDKWSAWKQFAFMDSNVASAQKLQDSQGVYVDRTIWNALVARVAALENK